MSEKKIGYVIRIDGSGPGLYCMGQQELIDGLFQVATIQEGPLGEKFEIEVVELTDQQIADLPEFQGF